MEFAPFAATHLMLHDVVFVEFQYHASIILRVKLESSEEQNHLTILAPAVTNAPYFIEK